jgi:hypothetical protein
MNTRQVWKEAHHDSALGQRHLALMIVAAFSFNTRVVICRTPWLTKRHGRETWLLVGLGAPPEQRCRML